MVLDMKTSFCNLHTVILHCVMMKFGHLDNNDRYGWLGSRAVSVLDSGAEGPGPGSNHSRDAVG